MPLAVAVVVVVAPAAAADFDGGADDDDSVLPLPCTFFKALLTNGTAIFNDTQHTHTHTKKRFH